ncbi:MAG: glycosyltransferase [Lachnospiraceae bacterium]
MKIAVLMSSYNGENYIIEQIESVLSQKKEYKSDTLDKEVTFELDLWVRDDGSKDSTPAILQNYKKQDLLKWYIGDNLGPAFSFLDLMKHCEGYDYYAFCDQDDVWNQDKMLKAVSMLQKNDLNQNQPCLYLSNAQLVDGSLNPCGRNVYKQNPKVDFETVACAGGLLGCTMVFNEALAKLLRDYPMPKKIIMHDAYTSLVCLSLDGMILYDECATMKYRQHEENVVGVARGFFGKIIDRCNHIFCKSKVSIADQAKEILSIYGGILQDDKKAWLSKVANYRDCFGNKMSLAASKKTKYINKNMAITNRLAILFGSK